jgi:hypothetical protein
MRLATALVVVGSLAACGATPAPRPPRSLEARAPSPAELLPDDLDFVVRVDAARIRQNPALAGVVRDVAKVESSALLEPIQAALGEASAIWVGTRWMSDGFHGDGVVAIEAQPGGDAFAHARPTSPPWRHVALDTSDVEAFEREATARGDAVLQIEIAGRGVVLATAAEADAVLRLLRSAPDDGRLDPPARGLLSFAGRLRTGAPIGDAPASAILRELTEGLVGYTGSLEEGAAADGVSDGAVEVEVSLAYASPSDASRASERAKQAAERLVAAGGTVGTVAHSMKLTEVGPSLRIRAAVPFAWLAKLH